MTHEIVTARLLYITLLPYVDEEFGVYPMYIEDADE